MLIYSHNQYSTGAKALAQALGIRRIKHERSRFRGRLSKVVLNWGASSVPEQVARCTVINEPENVAISINKLSTFLTLDGYVEIPDYTSNMETARTWFNEEENTPIMCRTVVNGSSGTGIVIATDPSDLVPALLYTKYIKKSAEYRVHVGFIGDRYEVIDVQRKARRPSVSDELVNWYVRNVDNGFIYVRNDVHPPQNVIGEAITAMEVLGLDFGAVDVVHSRNDLAYILEVNTAPGLEGTTLRKYADYFREWRNYE